MKNRYYTYCYLDPRRPGNYFYEGIDFCFLYEPFYIGRDRYTDHLREVKNNGKISNRIKIKEKSLPINKGRIYLIELILQIGK